MRKLSKLKPECRTETVKVHNIYYWALNGKDFLTSVLWSFTRSRQEAGVCRGEDVKVHVYMNVSGHHIIGRWAW